MADFSTERTVERFQKDFPQWLVNLHDPLDLFRRQPTYTISQGYCIIGAVVCLLHAVRRGGRWPFLWLASAIAGLLIEGCAYFSPYNGETIWSSPTAVDLFGQRVPLFVFFVYPFFYYQAFWAVAKLQLKCRWSEHIAAGMLFVLFGLPFDMIGIKYLHWTLHATEPKFAERVYSVPWTLLFFFAACTFSFSYLFLNLPKWLGNPSPAGSGDRFVDRGTIRTELAASVGAACLSVLFGSGLFLAFTYPLHAVVGIPNKIIITGAFLCVVTVFWKFDRKSNRRLPFTQSIGDHSLNLYIVMHFWLYLAIAILVNPQDAVSTGRHQPIGDCNNRSTLLCLKTFDKAYFDFHCLAKPPAEGSYWYTVCGTPFENRPEIIFVLLIITFLGTMIHCTLHYDYDVRFKIYELVRKNVSPEGKAKKMK